MTKLTLQNIVAGLNSTDPEQERDPPPEPTPVTFPSHEAFEGDVWKDEFSPPNFQSLFSSVLKPTDISEHHKRALNISILPPCCVDELVPEAPEGTSYLPDIAPRQDLSEESYANATKFDPALSKKRKDLEDRLSELRIENDLAFRAISRTVSVGVKPPRLAYMRKFWEGLESMSQYWDCSLDRYYEKDEAHDGGEKSAKRQRLENELAASEHADLLLKTAAERTRPIFEHTPSHEDQENQNPDEDGAEQQAESKTRSSSATPDPRTRMRYKGRRTATGRAMPDQFRADTVRGFVEGTIWPFQTTLSSPRVMPLVQFNKLNLPVRQSAAVYRVPRDRIKGRQGWLEGPIVSVQVRAETDFESEGNDAEVKARLDLMREIGGLLQLAQERRREGKVETKPGEGKWWTTKPRWGGGSGSEVENEIGNSDVVQAAEELLDSAKENNNGNRAKEAGRSRKRKTPAMLWKELKCGRAYWDPKTDYSAIGKSSDSACDEVRLSSPRVAASTHNALGVLGVMSQPSHIDCQNDRSRRLYGIFNFSDIARSTSGR